MSDRKERNQPAKPRKKASPGSQSPTQAAVAMLTREQKQLLNARNKVVAETVLEEIRMVSSAMHVAANYYSAHDAPSLDLKLKDPVELSPPNEKGGLAARYEWSVSGTHGDEVTLTISAVFIINFVIPIGSSPEAYERFITRLGKMGSYPYFRAHVSMMSDAASAGLPPLPIIRG